MSLRTLPARALALPGRIRTERTHQYAALATLAGVAGTIAVAWPDLGTGVPMSFLAGLLFGLLVADRSDVAFHNLASWVGLLAGSPMFVGYARTLPLFAEWASEGAIAAVFTLGVFAFFTLIFVGTMAFLGLLGGWIGARIGDVILGHRRAGSPS